MAYMQRTRILADNDLDDDTTWRQRLDLTGKITCIELRIDCNRFAVRTLNTVCHTLESCISRIELLRDATTPLLSLTGQQLDAMNYWDLGRPNARRYRQEAATGNILTLYLLGGRDFYDREYGWDFDILDKVYLEYTYDLQEGIADYFEADDHDIEVYVWQWKGSGVPNFKGFFRSKQLDSWTTSAEDAEHRIEIPASNPIRRVAVQGTTRTATLGGTFSMLDLQVDKGAFSPIIVRNPMLWLMNEVQEYKLNNELGGIEVGLSGQAMDIPYWWAYYQTIQLSSYINVDSNDQVYGLITLPGRIINNTVATEEIVFTSRGWGFQKCLRLGFDHEYDGFDLLKVPGGKSLDLLCTEAAASKVAKSFFQDVISY